MSFGLLEWLSLGLGAFIAGSSKGGLPGLNTLGVVLFAQVLPAKAATGALLPLLIVADVVAVLMFRRQANWPELRRVFPSTAVGVVVGALLLGRVDDAQVRRVVGLIIVALTALQVWRLRSPSAGLRLVRHPFTVATVGVLAGFTTLVANAAGPVMTLYLLAMRLPKAEFVGTSAWFFLIVNAFKVPFVVALGLINASSLVLDARLALFAVVGALGGRWVMNQLGQKGFETIALVLALVGGVRLLV